MRRNYTHSLPKVRGALAEKAEKGTRQLISEGLSQSTSPESIPPAQDQNLFPRAPGSLSQPGMRHPNWELSRHKACNLPLQAKPLQGFCKDTTRKRALHAQKPGCVKADLAQSALSGCVEDSSQEEEK